MASISNHKTKNQLVAPLAILLVALSITSSKAQLTPQALLAPAVNEYGPQYRDVEVAVIKFKSGDFDSARESLAAACKSHPQLAPADVMMSLLYLSVGRRTDAEAALERAIVDQPDDPEAYVLVADLALVDGRLVVADLGYNRGEKLLENCKSNAHRYQNLKIRLNAGLASLKEARGQFDLAANHLNEWIALDPKSPIAWGSLGRVSFHRKDYKAATNAFTKLNELDKDTPPVEIAMGRLFWEAGMREEARRSMEWAVKNAGDDMRARLTVAEWALNAGLIEMATENAKAVLKKDNESVGGHVLSARIARQTGNYDEAETILTKAVLRWPDHFLVTNELARALAASADAKKRNTGLDYARRNFQAYTNRNTDVGREAMLTFAWLLFQNGRAAEAEAVLFMLPDGSVISNENAFYAANIYSKQGKNAIARSALDAAISSDVAFPGKDDAKKLLDTLAKQGD